MSIDPDKKRLDDAARAGWLYYVGGKTQEEIAALLAVSRQTAQRLVSLATSEGLIRVRLEHPIARAMSLARDLQQAFGLDVAEVAPALPDQSDSVAGIAQVGASAIERVLLRKEPTIVAIGTGRTLKASVEQMQVMDASHHRIVSLTGNIAPDGSAAYYNVIFSLANVVKARLYPLPLPVIASSQAERDLLHKQALLQTALTLAAEARFAFVGVGDVGEDAPLVSDGFLTPQELRALRKEGAVGEICGWVYDAAGRVLDHPTIDRVASARLPSRETASVVAIAQGAKKVPSIRGALVRRLVNGLITDEATAIALLNNISR